VDGRSATHRANPGLHGTGRLGIRRAREPGARGTPTRPEPGAPGNWARSATGRARNSGALGNLVHSGIWCARNSGALGTLVHSGICCTRESGALGNPVHSGEPRGTARSWYPSAPGCRRPQVSPSAGAAVRPWSAVPVADPPYPSQTLQSLRRGCRVCDAPGNPGAPRIPGAPVNRHAPASQRMREPARTGQPWRTREPARSGNPSPHGTDPPGKPIRNSGPLGTDMGGSGGGAE
jgi:hypothetical protein